MRKHFKLSAVASLMVIVLGGGSLQVYSQDRAALRMYTAEQSTSLYQLALQSGINLDELRRLNKGSLDRRDTLKAGETLLLPASSPLFPRDSKEKGNEQGDPRWESLPELGNGNEPLSTVDKSEQQAAKVAQRIGAQDWNNLSGTQLQSQAENWAKSEAKSRVLTPAQQQAQDLLGKFGKAQVNLSVDDKGDLSRSSASLLTPLHDGEDNLLFSQLGVHDQDGRTIGNFGVGQRWDVVEDSWLLGYNAFFDHDFSRHHSRLGLGAEAWTDYLKLGANYYHPLSDWRDSKDAEDRLERAAEGFDIRTQAYLPAYPQLGASAVYEQYFGDEVALFGKDNLQRDPHAITLGVDYTPFPLATLKASHKQGQDGNQESRFDLTLNVQLGTALSKQLDPDNVAAMRSLMGSRYDLVDRNYDIVLEYKDKQTLGVDLAAVPNDLLEGDTYIMQPLVRSKYQITAVTWNGDIVPLALVATAGDNNPQGWRITLPAWSAAPGDSNRYQLAIMVEDEKGNQVTSNTVDILVGQQRQISVALQDDKGEANADGVDEITLLSHIKDHQGNILNESETLERWQILDEAGQDLVAAGVVQVTRTLDSTTGERTLVLTANKDVNAWVSADFGPYGKTGTTPVKFIAAVQPVLDAKIYIGSGEDAPLLVGSPQVDTEYSVKIWDTQSGVPVDVTEEYRETIKWHLVEDQVGNNDAVVATGTDLFTTQVANINASHQHSQHLSEQGMRLYVEYAD